MARYSTTRSRAKKAGFRSGFEQLVAGQLVEAGVAYEYESTRIKYQKAHTYTPDFILPNGVIIEAKGRFTGADRSKHELIRAQHPELDIRFVFMKDNPILTGSKTRYSDWCEKRGIPWCIVTIPEAWYE